MFRTIRIMRITRLAGLAPLGRPDAARGRRAGAEAPRLDLAELPVVDPLEVGCAMPWSLDPAGDPQTGPPAPPVPEPELPLPGSPRAG